MTTCATLFPCHGPNVSDPAFGSGTGDDAIARNNTILLSGDASQENALLVIVKSHSYSTPPTTAICLYRLGDLILGTSLDDPSTTWTRDTVWIEQRLRQLRNDAAGTVETGEKTPSRSHADLIEECLVSLGTSKSTLAEILGISRPTLYAWHENRVETPDTRPLSRLQRLVTLLREAGITADQPIRRHLVQRPLSGETAALAELLKASSWDEPRLRRLLAAVKAENETIEAETLCRRNRDRRRAYVDADEGLDTGLTSLEWDNL